MNFLNVGKDKICVAIEDENLRLAHLKNSSGIDQVAHIASRDIRGLPEDEIPKIIKTILADFKVKKASTICAIPSSVTTTKNIEIPSVNPEEIKSIINLQAGRHTPFSREEIVIDYLSIGVFQRNYSKILLVIINRSSIKKQINILEAVGLEVDKILLVPEAISFLYSHVCAESAAKGPMGIIDISDQETDFSIAFQSKVIACRSIPVGMKLLEEDAQNARNKLLDELKSSVESYRSEDIEQMPLSYVLTCDNEIIKELQPQLKDKLQAEVNIVSYLDNLKVSSDIKEKIEELGGGSFLSVVAPMVHAKDCQMDFLPEEIKIKKSIEQQGKEVAKCGIFSVVLLICLSLMFISKLHFKSSALNELKRRHAPKRQEVQELEEVFNKTLIIKDYLNSRLTALDILDELYRLVPNEIYFKSITLDETGKIILQGTSESMSTVFSLVDPLEDAELFKNVKTTSTTATKERGKDVSAFEMSLRLEGTKENEGLEEEQVESGSKEENEE